MAELIKVNAPVRKPLFEGVQGENEARSIQFDIEPWVTELGDGAVTATAKRSQDSQPYPVTVTKDGNIVTWKPTSTDTAYAGVGSFQLEYTVDSVLAKTCIWSTMVAPSLDPAGDPPDPYDNWLAEMRQIAADALQSEQNAEDSAENAEAWAVGQRGGVDVPSTDPTYENNAKYWAEQSLANQYGAYIVKSASGDIASFSDGADDIPMKSLKVAIVPKQAGSGDPSPSNVRPITGWTDADVNVIGKNLYRYGDQSFTRLKNVGQISLKAGDYCVSAEVTSADTTQTTSKFEIDNAQGSAVVNCYLTRGARAFYRFTLTEDVVGGSIYLFSSTSAGASTGKDATWKNVQIELGTTATPFEPYTSHTTPVPLGQTVYGGELHATSGELTINRAIIDLATSQSGWYMASTMISGKQRLALTISDIKVNTQNVISNVLPFVGGNGTYAGTMGIGTDANPRITLYKDNLQTVNDWKAWAIANSLKVCYELATPTTVQLTPTQVATLLGTNNVWSDAGSVEVEYRADPTLAYAELQALILENI